MTTTICVNVREDSVKASIMFYRNNGVLSFKKLYLLNLASIPLPSRKLNHLNDEQDPRRTDPSLRQFSKSQSKDRTDSSLRQFSKSQTDSSPRQFSKFHSKDWTDPSLREFCKSQSED
ncbi:hypothetical protein BsWGS_21142 [Bradybaena similaris]